MSTQVLQPLALDLALPWSPNKQQEEIFYRWTRNTFVVLLIIFILVPWLPVYDLGSKPVEKKIVKTKVILESLRVAQVKPKVTVATPKPKPKLKPKPKVARQKKVTQPASSKKSKPKSASNGLASLSSQLTQLRGKLNVAGMKNKKVTKSGKGMVATVDRNILGENRATKATLGIQVDDNIMKTASTQLASHQTSNVEGMVSIGKQGELDSAGTYISGQRDEEAIRRIIEQKKGMIYALYYSALTDNPELHGKFVFKFNIEPSGKVSKLAILSSELGVDDLERRILSRIQNFDFGMEDVSATAIEYRFVFIPS